MVPQIIGLTGKARHGKTTVAEHLRDHYGYTIVSAAEPLKALVIAGLERNPPPDTEGQWNWDRLVRHDRTPFTRWLLQYVGTDIGRAIDPDIWAAMLANEIGRTEGSVVVPDVRFENEAAVIEALGGEVWRIVRPNCPGGVEHGAGHVSETEQERIVVARTITAGEGVVRLRELVDDEMGVGPRGAGGCL